MNFFLDNTFAPRVARALAILLDPLDHGVAHLLDMWKPDPGDPVWIPELVKKPPGNWIVLSGDRKLSTNPQRQAAIREAGHVLFVMPGGLPERPLFEQASLLFRWFPKIVEHSTRAKRKQGFRVQMNGSVHRIP